MKNEEFVETDQFLKRKNSLINRLFRSKAENLDEKPNSGEILAEEKKVESKFFEEYIPLDSEPPKKVVEKISGHRESYDPIFDNLENYNGPYSKNCLLKVRRSLIESFKPVTKSTVYTDRTFEILKLKLKIPSKFDGDRKLMNRIRTKQKEHLYDVSLKLRLAEKLSVRNLEKSEKFERKPATKPNKHVFMVDEDTDSDNKSFVSDYSFDKNEKKIVDKFELTKNSDVFFNLYQESVTNLEEVKTKLTDESEKDDDDDNDVDSKCRQFDKYSKVISKNQNQKSFQSEISEMEQKYREVRDERNKLNKNIKKDKNKSKNKNNEDLSKTVSKVEMNVKREELGLEMKKIRNNLKKLRKSSRHESRRIYKQRKRKQNF